MKPQLQLALSKLEPGSYSLTVRGFCRRALKLTDISRSQEAEIIDVMDGLLPGCKRRVQGMWVWDVQV